MRKEMCVLLITLIVGAYFSFVPSTVRAQSFGVHLQTNDNTEITTILTDTHDITFTVSLSTDADDHITFKVLLVDAPTGSLPLTISSLPALPFETGPAKDLKVTIGRTIFSAVGKYVVSAEATSSGDGSQSSSLKFTINVKAPTKPYDVGITSFTYGFIYGPTGLFVTGWPFQLSNTRDATYTLNIENNGTNLDQIFLTVSGELDNATLNPTKVLLDPGTEGVVTLTIPRASFSKPGSFEMNVTAVSENDVAAAATFSIYVYVTDDRPIIPDPTLPTPDPTLPTPDQSTNKVILSEFMFEAGGGKTALPQWIEVYNSGNSAVNLRGWKLEWNSLQPTPVAVTTTLDADFRIPAQQARLIVTALGKYSGSNLSNATVYQLRSEKIGEGLIIEYIQDITGGFSLKLTNPDDEVIDHIGTLSDDGEKKAWELPETLIEGYRSSLIRRFDGGVPRSGIERRGWIRAYNAKRVTPGLYYGSSFDLGTPGYRRGKPLPVELSQFSAKFVKDEVVINWTTESELDNAGFNIYRSTSRTNDFQRINTKLIQGAGTTGERNTYKWVDLTAKAGVVYYYQIEDLSFAGERQVLTTSRLKGYVFAKNKLPTAWGELKSLR